MKTYVIRDRNGVFATILTSLGEEEFREELHSFQCGEDFSDRRQLTINDFAAHMRNKRYSCEVDEVKETYHWWLQD